MANIEELLEENQALKNTIEEMEIEHLKSLNESDEKLRSYFDNSLSAALITDGSTGILAANNAAVELFGWTEEELKTIGRDGIIYKYEPKLIYALEIRNRTGKFNGELSWVKKDGTIFIGETNSTLYKESNGITKASIFIKDVTEQKKILENILESEERFRRMFENNSAIMLLINPQSGAIVEVNSAAEKFYGYSADNLKTMKIGEINQFNSEQIVQEMEAAESQKRVYFIFPHRLANGEIRTVEVHSTPILFNKVNLLMSIVHDISDRVKIENELKQSEANFSAFFNTINDLLFVLDTNGNILKTNKIVETSLGYNEAELTGKNVLLVHPESQREEAGRIVAAMLAGKEKICPIPLATKSGGEIPVETRVVMGKWNGETAIFGVSKDMTDIKRSEEKFEKIFKNNPSLMIVSTINDGLIIDANEAFYRKLGYMPNEVIGKTSNELNLYLDINQREIAVDILKKNGAVKDFEVLIKSKNGEIITGLFSADIIEMNGEKLLLSVLIDISEKKNAENALFQQKEWLDAILNATHSGVMIIDKETLTIVDMNKAALDMVGLKKEEALGKLCHNFVCAAEINKCPIINLKQEIINKERTLLNSKGEEIPIIKSATIKSIGGKEYLVESFIDITERKKIEIELKESEKKYRKIFENVQDVFFQSDLSGALIDISPSIERYSYFTREELIGKSVETVYQNPDDRKRFVQVLMKTGEVIDYEVGLKTKNGSPIIASLNAHLIKDSGGNIIGIEGSLRDISDRKRIEMALKESEEKLRTIFDILPVGITITDKDGNLVDGNHKSEEILGLSPEEQQTINFVGKGLRIVRPDITIMPPEEFASVRAMNENRTIMDVLMGLEKSEDNITWINVCASPLPISNYGVAITYSDVSEIIKKENELILLNDQLSHNKNLLEDKQFHLNRIIEELELSKLQLTEANKSKDKFFSIIAHDLKSPFSGLIGISDIMSKELESLSIQDLKEMANALSQSTNSTFKLLNELLDWSRVQTGNMPFYPEKLNLEEIALLTITTLKQKADLKKIKLISNAPDKILATCDRAMISTVIRNLVSNAIKFTYEGGEIEVSILDKEFYIETSVKDNGTGISQDNIKKLFNIESPISANGTAGEKGTGLGLLLCKEFVEKHRGKIWVESELGKGSTFYFSLPIIED